MASLPRATPLRDDTESFASYALPAQGGAGATPLPPGTPTRAARSRAASARARWIPPGEAVEVQGLVLPGGMLYVGKTLRGQNRDVEPALINPELPLSVKKGDESRAFATNYAPDYHQANRSDRRAYLQWLAGGRQNPAASIGLPMLFFFGLERRLVYDAAKKPEVLRDRDAILAEIERLLTVYGAHPGLANRARHLQDYLAAQTLGPRCYLSAPQPHPRSFQLPYGYQVALGQMAFDKQPLTPAWAAAWACQDGLVYQSKPLRRHPELFRRAFEHHYAGACPEGLRLQPGPLPLRLHYDAVSPSLRDIRSAPLEGAVPVLNDQPIRRQLQGLVDRCEADLEPYVRYVGLKPEKAQGVAALLLPDYLRPAALQQQLLLRQAQVARAPLVLPLAQVIDFDDAPLADSRAGHLALATVLAHYGIGLEPDLLGEARRTKGSDMVVLFPQPAGDQRALTADGQAALTLVEAACSYVLDEHAPAEEVQWLLQQVAQFACPDASLLARLAARAELCRRYPVPPAQMKRRLAGLPVGARAPLGQLLVNLVRRQGPLLPQLVRLLEQIYAALQLERAQLYRDLALPGPVEAPSPVAALTTPPPLVLNREHIAALQQETREVATLLGAIFAEDEAPPPAPAAVPGPYGLDLDHAALLCQLLTRPQWARAELEALADRYDLMLEGALEVLNDVIVDQLGELLAKGEDPIDINPTLREHLAQELNRP